MSKKQWSPTSSRNFGAEHWAATRRPPNTPKMYFIGSTGAPNLRHWIGARTYNSISFWNVWRCWPRCEWINFEGCLSNIANSTAGTAPEPGLTPLPSQVSQSLRTRLDFLPDNLIPVDLKTGAKPQVASPTMVQEHTVLHWIWTHEPISSNFQIMGSRWLAPWLVDNSPNMFETILKKKLPNTLEWLAQHLSLVASQNCSPVSERKLLRTS